MADNGLCVELGRYFGRDDETMERIEGSEP